MISIVQMVVVPVVPSVFRAIVGVFTAVVYIIPSEHAIWMFSDLLLDHRMLPKEFFYLLMFVEIFAVVYQLRIGL